MYTKELAIEHQGEGTYTYNCIKPDCHYCIHVKEQELKAKQLAERTPVIVRKLMNYWQPHEDEWIINNYGKISHKKIALPKRSKGSIRSRAYQLRISGRGVAKYDSSNLF